MSAIQSHAYALAEAARLALLALAVTQDESYTGAKVAAEARVEAKRACRKALEAWSKYRADEE